MNNYVITTVTGSIISAIEENQDFIDQIQYGKVVVTVKIHDGKVVDYEVTPTVKKRLDN